ncbi:four helix bundle suffix domain-containing protein [uncultured Porphyromonas sp.]|uniref:four helix bundle suffix domain-containing protein n=1 Tax=uncultured Porphyromonas sp. TaxID=159274 RepID=UPI0025FF8C30|nr:four helix bundle suffix domain-containing protein [uncultured Porphyromonas sp.]
MTKPFLKQRGGYRSLKVYRVTTLIYDLTYHFAHTYLSCGDRTIDQMVQAARSGKQNIAEGSTAGTHSSETEIRLTDVAKASLEELMVDYEDYLRTRELIVWGPGHPRYDRLRAYARSEGIYSDCPKIFEQMSDEELANLAITLIHQATYMLRRLVERQQEMFLEGGGIREQMSRARRGYRSPDKR